MCKRYKVRLQIDIPVGIFQLSRAIELEIDIDRLRSLKLPARPIGLALRSLRSFRVAVAPWCSLRSLSGRLRLPARRLRLLALRSAALHSASPSAPWHGLRPKVWGLTPQLPDYVAVSPQRRPRSAHRALPTRGCKPTIRHGLAESVFRLIWIPTFDQPHLNYLQGATESKIRRPIGEIRPFSH